MRAKMHEGAPGDPACSCGAKRSQCGHILRAGAGGAFDLNRGEVLTTFDDEIDL